MPNNRKHVRIAIPADLVDAFRDAKKDVESSLRVDMTDAQFAAHLIRWALKQEKQP